MLFNSIDFAVFLPLVFALYWFVFKGNLRIQNFFLVAASYIFYGWWDWRFLILMTATILCSYAGGILIDRARRETGQTSIRRRTRSIVAANIILNLLILGFFKYYNFFAQSFADAFTLFGKPPEIHTLKIILPVGISFYTFQALSYTIDVYRRKLEPTRDWVAFFAFVSFFPQLVAGPIERATNLLTQFYVRRTFNCDRAADGMRQILWGLFKKIVIADNCATVVNGIFGAYETMPANQLAIGAIAFTFQIYGDFSGYSNIAIGTARLFGFNLMRNFAFPYFSRDIAEFWRRWHISLTTWFRDYIYIPLGGSRCAKSKVILNTWIIFLVSGLWHGANWTFVAWGAYHALLFMPLLLLGKNRRYTDIVAESRLLPTWKELFAMLTTIFKDSLLANVDSPRMIFIGGSNISFGLNGQMIKDSLNVNPINTGIAAGVGLKFMLDNTVRHIKTGDIVITPLEYSHYTCGYNHCDEALLRVVMDVDSEYLRLLNAQQILNLCPFAAGYFFSKLNPKAYFNVTVKPYLSRNSFNRYGDEHVHWGMENPVFIPHGRLDDYNPKIIENIKKFEKIVEEKGGKLYLTYPSYLDKSFAASEDIIATIRAGLEKNFKVLGTPERYMMPDSLMFDTSYHLNKKGVDIRTARLIEDIKKAEGL